jgi:HTH-type transcriptional regulator/antitoxin HigA
MTRSIQSRNAASPDAQAILRAWTPFKRLVGVTTVRNEKDYAKAMATIDALLEEVRGDDAHPLAEVLDYLSEQVRAFEAKRFPIAHAEPREVLRLLMDQHGLRQEDLSECAPQGRISEILAGRRAISKEVAKRLAQRFGVPADVFL